MLYYIPLPPTYQLTFTKDLNLDKWKNIKTQSPTCVFKYSVNKHFQYTWSVYLGMLSFLRDPLIAASSCWSRVTACWPLYTRQAHSQDTETQQEMYTVYISVSVFINQYILTGNRIILQLHTLSRQSTMYHTCGNLHHNFI